MRSIATVNFKGGVGKTTITWLLAKYLSEIAKKKVLVFHIDAQMSLTLAVQLQENGAMFNDFERWYENTHIGKNRTILNALERFDIRQRRHF
jgi:chromosome partitioning protein